AAIALRNDVYTVERIARDPTWSVYGVGIIKQSNVVRAMSMLGLLEDYLEAGFGFDHVDVFGPDGKHVATVPSPKLTPGYPANVGIARPALHQIVRDRASASGTDVRLCLVVACAQDDRRW